MPFPTSGYQPGTVQYMVEIYRPEDTSPGFGETAIAFDFPVDDRFEPEYQAFAEAVRAKYLSLYPAGYSARIFRACRGGQADQEVGDLYPAAGA